MVMNILFSNTNPNYFPGDTVNGILVINLESEMSMAKIDISLEGRAKVSMRIRRNKKTRTIHNKEFYVQLVSTVFQGPSLPRGEHRIPFAFNLPQNIPSSFHSSNNDSFGPSKAKGNVEYKIKAKIVRNWRFDEKFKQEFPVIGILDLNMFPRCMEPGDVRKNKTVCCLFWASGPISAIMKTNRFESYFLVQALACKSTTAGLPISFFRTITLPKNRDLSYFIWGFNDIINNKTFKS